MRTVLIAVIVAFVLTGCLATALALAFGIDSHIWFVGGVYFGIGGITAGLRSTRAYWRDGLAVGFALAASVTLMSAEVGLVEFAKLPWHQKYPGHMVAVSIVAAELAGRTKRRWTENPTRDTD